MSLDGTVLSDGGSSMGEEEWEPSIPPCTTDHYIPILADVGIRVGRSQVVTWWCGFCAMQQIDEWFEGTQFKMVLVRADGSVQVEK